MFQSKRVRTFAAMCVTQLPLCLARQVFGATSDWVRIGGAGDKAQIAASKIPRREALLAEEIANLQPDLVAAVQGLAAGVTRAHEPDDREEPERGHRPCDCRGGIPAKPEANHRSPSRRHRPFVPEERQKPDQAGVDRRGRGRGSGGYSCAATMEHETGYGGAVAGTVVLGAAIGAGVGRLASGPGESLIYRSAEHR